MNKIRLSEEARVALCLGIERGDTLAQLEEHLDQQIIDILDRNGIVFLEDLANLTLDAVMTIDGIGLLAVNTIIDMVRNYHRVTLTEVR